MVPVWIGAQGVGKSTGVKAIAPLPEAYVEIDLNVRDDDMARKMRGALVGEIGELRGLNGRDRDAVKAFITRTHERWTPKYQERDVIFARRLLFIGTFNPGEFLDDETGNRRWLPVKVTKVDVSAILRDRDQLWAEGAVLFRQGGVAFAEAERLAREEHEQFAIEDPWLEPIKGFLAQLANEEDGYLREGEQLNGKKRKGDVPFTSRTVLRHLGFDDKDINRGHQMRVARVLRKLGYEPANIRGPDGPGRYWVLAGADTTRLVVEAERGGTSVGGLPGMGCHHRHYVSPPPL